MSRRRILPGLIASVLALVIGLSVWSFAAAQGPSAQPFLGVGIQSAANGVQVTEVVAGSPAETAGIQVGDIITAVDGTTVTADTIHAAFATHKIGDTVKLSVTRAGKTMDVSATLVAAPEVTPEPNPSQPNPPTITSGPVLGVSLQDSANGPVIAQIVPNSAAEKAGLKTGDIITKIGDTDVKTAADAAAAIHAMNVGDSVSITVTRAGSSQTVQAALASGSTVQVQPFPPQGNGNGNGNGNGPFGRGRGTALIYNGNDKTWEIRGLSQDNALYQAGLRQGDVIKTFDGQSYDPQGLQTYLQGLDPTKNVTLSITRSGASQDITVTAGDLSGLIMFSIGGNGGNGFPFGNQPFDFNQLFNGARLGVQFVTLNADEAKSHNVTLTNGALVTDVMAGTPAEKAGLQVNDIITAVNGNKLDADHTLRDWLLPFNAGDTITLDVTRGTDAKQISVTLDQATMSDIIPFFPQGFQFPGQGDQNGFPFQQPQPPQPQTTPPNV